MGIDAGLVEPDAIFRSDRRTQYTSAESFFAALTAPCSKHSPSTAPHRRYMIN